ncbi:MAG: hypothetical protein U9N34_07170 [Candidatus Cloacimonadota bacterium]|nr:hypothetical protein [Candidatus Cloacimonadota bacterium]
MEAIKKYYNDLPEIITIPKELIHRKGEIIIIIEDYKESKNKSLKDFFGYIPSFPERTLQGSYEERSKI